MNQTADTFIFTFLYDCFNQTLKQLYFAYCFQRLYSDAVALYGKEDWAAAIKTMEEALNKYYYEYDRCLVHCEGKYDHEELPDFYNAIAGKKLTGNILKS